MNWPIKPPVVSATLAIAAAMAIALGMPAAASGQTVSRVGSSYLFGANMPWLNWAADFGGGPGHGGVSANLTEVDTKLQAAHAAGMHLVRWWMFEGGSWQIQRDAGGTPTSLDPNVYTDLDAALTEAAKYDISFDMVLFGGTNDDSTTHQWWEDSAKRQALARVLTPLFQRYASNPRVHTWEIVNEPEWQSRNGVTSVAGMLATSDLLANAVHVNSRALVTVGSAQLQDMSTWAGHPLDYYSPHYYDNFGTGPNDPFVMSASSPDGKPVVVGEFPADSGYTPTAAERWQALYSGGYAGGWSWSLSPEHTSDHIATDLRAAAAFSSGKSDLGPRGPGSGPTSTPTLAAATATSMPATATLVPATATATPTATRASATPTTQPSPQASWSLTGSVSPTSVAPGSSVTVRSRVMASQNATAILDVEIYDQTWHRVYQRIWDSQSFVANRARIITTEWTIPSGATAGKYTVMIGTFAPGWKRVYSFNNSAASFILP